MLPLVIEAREVLRSEVITRNGNGKGQLRSDSRVNRYMAVLGSIFTACTKQFRWIKFSYATDHMKAPPNPSNVLGMLPENGTRDRESLTPKEIQKSFRGLFEVSETSCFNLPSTHIQFQERRNLLFEETSN